MSEGHVLSEEELRRSEEMLRTNLEVFGMQTNQHEANLITTIRDRDKQIAELTKVARDRFDSGIRWQQENAIMREALETSLSELLRQDVTFEESCDSAERTIKGALAKLHTPSREQTEDNT